MKIICLYEWDITHEELVDWSITNDLTVYAIAESGPSSRYAFEDDGDYIAFTLRFRKK